MPGMESLLRDRSRSGPVDPLSAENSAPVQRRGLRAGGAGCNRGAEAVRCLRAHRKPDGSVPRVCGLEDPLASSVKTSNRPRPQSVEEALAQSRQHARLALSEVLRSVSCLIDAAALALGAGQNPILDTGWTALVSAIDEVAGKLAGVQVQETQLDGVSEILAALEVEISRWKGRASQDEHAQAVLIAFMGLHEMVWEMRHAREPAPLKTESIGASRSRRPSPIRSAGVSG